MQLTYIYQDWTIRLHKADRGWSFEATPPEDPEPMTDGCIHTSIETAILISGLFVQMHQFQAQFCGWLDAMRHDDRISQDEYENALTLAATMTNFLDLLAPAQTQL